VATAWVEVAVAATDPKQMGSVSGAVLLAALALPGLCPTQALAENPPEKSTVAYKHLYYNDRQPGKSRITVHAPSVAIEAPLGSEWSVSVTGVNDVVTGASPRKYTAVTGATMHDNRTAFDGSVTYYRPLSAYSLSLSHSAEHDYISEAVGLNARFASEDHNTTVNVGVGVSADTITSTTSPDLFEHKNTNEFLLGVTQALTRSDLLQANLGYSTGTGYYSDSYKTGDVRPDSREQYTALVRWNHHFESMGASLRTSYRFYTDTWRMRTHTVQAEWVQPLNEHLTLTPLLRYYTQNSAYFYADPVGSNYGMPTSLPDGAYLATDQRLSAFGAVTLGLRVDYKFNEEWTGDVKAEVYQQKADWRIGGDGSPGLQPFKALTLQWGLKRAF
jgi:YaiO family outer membrane protein